MISLRAERNQPIRPSDRLLNKLSKNRLPPFPAGSRDAPRRNLSDARLRKINLHAMSIPLARTVVSACGNRGLRQARL